MNFLKRVQGLIYPEKLTCDFCGREIFSGKRVCEDCERDLPKNAGYICFKCGRRTHMPTELCETCVGKELFYDGARSAFCYDGYARKGLVNLKFNNMRYLARTFAEYMRPVYLLSGFNADVAVCAPIGRQRLFDRGYNQSELIAREVCELVGLEFCPHALLKIKETQSQVGLTDEERTKNLRGSFAVNEDFDAEDKTILVIDDVMTTGTTINEIARALKRAGAKEVYALTAASVDADGRNKY
ncbi:MAG: ComF family protein [Clostridia bacterium]|jgi:ComF family protein|nr:ComF family protein [Clostridia bacterium]